MKFCSNCDNMYYMKIVNPEPDSDDTEKKLIYFCKSCGNEVKIIDNLANFKVFKMNNENKSKDIHINEYTKYDPTLPHVSTIKCPNFKCLSNTNSEKYKQDVIYLRYDDKNMKYMYLCCNCDENWISS